MTDEGKNMPTTERVRADFTGGPADGQYRFFPGDTPPASINWMTADGTVVYRATETADGWIYEVGAS